MRAAISITMNNAAFDDEPEIELARILRDLAARVERGYDQVNLFDIDGKKVGEFKILSKRKN